MKDAGDDEYKAEEIARRRDEVVRRMANTPPRPRIKDHPPERKKTTAGDRAARNSPGAKA